MRGYIAIETEAGVEIRQTRHGQGEDITTAFRRAADLADWTPGLVLVEQPVLQPWPRLVFQEAGE